MLALLCFQKAYTSMDNPCSSSSANDAHDVPDWADWPLKPDGKLDGERLMPTTFLVCSKEYSESRQDLVKSLLSFAPRRDRLETKSVPVISNLTLLELYDLSGEVIPLFRVYVLETLGEFDRINSDETLMYDHESIKTTMTELRNVANEIHEKKSREESTVFLNKRANLAILGYFTRRDPRNQTDPMPLRPATRHFKEFICGNKGAARVSVYNWRHKKWGASVNRNLSLSPQDRGALIQRSAGPIRRVVATRSPSKVMKSRLKAQGPNQHAVQDKGEVPSTSTISESPDLANDSPSDAKKKKTDPGFNVKNAIEKGREEVNFYCAVRANKVDPDGFGLPKGFVKCGDKIVHHTRKERVESSRKRKRTSGKKQEEPKKDDMGATTTEESAEKSVSDKEEESGENLNESHENDEVVMDDIETDEEIDVSIDKQIVVTNESSSQTDDVMGTEDGDTVINPETAAQLKKMEAIHLEDMAIIQKLKVENGLAFRNLSKSHCKYVALFVERNNLKYNLNVVERERRTDKTEKANLTKTVRQLTQQNSILLNEVNLLKREMAMRDQLDFGNSEVGRYEEFSG